jgi:transposase InsO family protein
MLEFLWPGSGKSASTSGKPSREAARPEQPVTTAGAKPPPETVPVEQVGLEKNAPSRESNPVLPSEQAQDVSGRDLDAAVPELADDEPQEGGTVEGATAQDDRRADEPPADLGADSTGPVPGLASRRAGRRLVKPGQTRPPAISAQQRLLLLDTWRRSGLPAGDFAALVGLSKHTLYAWKKKFDTEGPAGLMEQPRGGPEGSRLPDLTKRAILMLKEANPEWGCERISDMLVRGPALPASAGAVARVLHEAGYETDEVSIPRHPDHVRHFERAKPNQLWQTDLFTFVLKRQNRRVYLVAFMDDHSRFIVGYGLHASQSTALVLEVLRAALTSYGTPEEVLTDNGSQYVTWRGKSVFTKELEKRGIRQIVAAPRRPQTLGKIERFWGTLWRECVESTIFLDLGDARRRLGLFIDHYNFQRVHRGCEGLVPADRFFGAAPEVKKTLQARVAANALELARNGLPKAPFYLTGQVGGQPFSVHAEGERVILTRKAGERQEIDLVRPAAETSRVPVGLPDPLCPQGIVAAGMDEGQEEPPAPGTSALDEGLDGLAAEGAPGGES